MKSKFGVVGTLDKWKKGDLVGHQMVNIVLDSYSTTQKGLICVTAQLATDSEVDHAVDSLIKDLEFVRKKAKEKIKKTNERIYAGSEKIS